MAVRIISESERGTFEYGEGSFQFRRAPLHKVKQWERAHYNKREGKPDYYADTVFVGGMRDLLQTGTINL